VNVIKVSKLPIQLPELKEMQTFPDLIYDIPFISVAGYPEVTNYTGDFKDLLDYIFIESDSFGIIRCTPFPTEDTLTKHIALPSKQFPSDHIALCVDLKLLKIL
jgi:2',5'-phosphodiesterase